MEAEVTAKVKKVFERKVTKVAIIGFIAIIILGVLFLLNYSKIIGSANKNASTQRTARVVKGDLSLTVTGSGPIISSNKDDIKPNVNSSITSKITKVYFKEGDTVKKGDLLFELDDSDARLNVDKAINSMQQTQLTQNSNIESVNKLIVRAPFSGYTSNIQIKTGDVLSKGATILTLTDTSRLKLLVPFNGGGIGSIAPGQQATVYLPALMQSVNGTVSYVSNKPYSTSSGGQLYNVEISIDNPGSLKDGMKANAEISTPSGTLLSTDNGTLTVANNIVIRSDTGGTVKKINVLENQYVNNGDVLVELQDDNIVMNKATTDLKIADLQRQLETAQNQLTYYKIYASIDGVIVKQNAKVGDGVSKDAALCSIADTQHMEFTIPVDELDIDKIQVGQKVNITIDALTDTTSKPLSGKVSKVAIQGTSNNGVATYPVTIAVDNPERLKEGMNANATIIVNSKSNVLYVPIEAVQKFGNRSVVMVKGTPEEIAAQKSRHAQFAGGSGRTGNRQNGGQGSGQTSGQNAGQSGGQTNGQTSGQSGRTGNANSQEQQRNSANQQYYANAVPKQVETGINNDSNIEIISGLKEGDEIILPPVTRSQSTQQNGGNNRGPGGFGGGGGGRPFGD